VSAPAFSRLCGWKPLAGSLKKRLQRLGLEAAGAARGAELASALLAEQLVDELQLSPSAPGPARVGPTAGCDGRRSIVPPQKLGPAEAKRPAERENCAACALASGSGFGIKLDEPHDRASLSTDRP